MQVRNFFFFIKYYLSRNCDQIPSFSIFWKTVLSHLNPKLNLAFPIWMVPVELPLLTNIRANDVLVCQMRLMNVLLTLSFDHTLNCLYLVMLILCMNLLSDKWSYIHATELCLVKHEDTFHVIECQHILLLAQYRCWLSCISFVVLDCFLTHLKHSKILLDVFLLCWLDVSHNCTTNYG